MPMRSSVAGSRKSPTPESTIASIKSCRSSSKPSFRRRNSNPASSAPAKADSGSAPFTSCSRAPNYRSSASRNGLRSGAIGFRRTTSGFAGSGQFAICHGISRERTSLTSSTIAKSEFPSSSVTRLQRAGTHTLGDPKLAAEAANILRGLIDHVSIQPDPEAPDGVWFELHGALAQANPCLRARRTAKSSAPRSGGGARKNESSVRGCGGAQPLWLDRSHPCLILQLWAASICGAQIVDLTIFKTPVYKVSQWHFPNPLRVDECHRLRRRAYRYDRRGAKIFLVDGDFLFQTDQAAPRRNHPTKFHKPNAATQTATTANSQIMARLREPKPAFPI